MLIHCSLQVQRGPVNTVNEMKRLEKCEYFETEQEVQNKTFSASLRLLFPAASVSTHQAFV